MRAKNINFVKTQKKYYFFEINFKSEVVDNQSNSCIF
jgi:hypothetical protein